MDFSEFTQVACEKKLAAKGPRVLKSSKFDDIKKVYLLKTLSEQGSLNKTAQIHKITPSAVSQTVKSLEISLGYPVIIKTTDSWKLTEKGLILMDQMQKVFEALAETFAEDLEEPLRLGSLAVGTYESIALEMVHELSEHVRGDYPGIKLTFQISRTAELIKKIHSGELCSAIIAQSDSLPEDFLKEAILTDRLGIYASPKLNLKTTADLNNQLMGMISGGTDGLPNYFKRFLKQVPNFKANLICDSFEVLKDLAEKGDAVVVLPQRIAAKAAKPLTEIQIENQTADGLHQILLIASGTCDRREFDYLSKILLKK